MAAVLLMVGQRLEQPDIVQQLLDIEQSPCKPQYQYASEVSSNIALHNCQASQIWHFS